MNNGTVTVTYPVGVNYNITMTPSGTVSNCQLVTIMGTAPCCSVSCTVGGPSSVCPNAATQHCAATGLPGYSWSISGNGVISGPTNQPCVNVVAGGACNTTYTLVLTVGPPNCQSTCTKTVTIEDTSPSVFTSCPSGSNLGCTTSGVPAPGTATATDNCGIPTITNALGTVTSNGCLRTQTHTYTATDGCSNTATCAQVFTWTFDVTPPAFTFCPPGSDLACNPTDAPGPGAAVATDAYGTPTITSSLGEITSNGCLHSQTRTYTATDGCINSSTCTQTFTSTVDPPVTLNCPGNMTTAACITQTALNTAFANWLNSATFTGGCKEF